MARLRRAGVVLSVAVVIALGAVFAAPASTSHAARASSGIAVGTNAQVIWQFLRLRTGPSLFNAIITNMPEGSVVSVIDGPWAADGFQWWEVNYQGNTGFAADVGLAPAGLSAPACNVTCALSPGIEVLVVNTPILHLRTSHTLHCSIILTMPEGATLTILSGPFVADGFHWWQVDYQGTMGYAAGEWLAPATSVSSSPCGVVVLCLTPGGNAVVADTPFLHLRASHTVSCPILLTLPEGATVEVLEGPFMTDGFHWWHVNYQGTDGYAAGEWLAPA
jgi:hypothetical protein